MYGCNGTLRHFCAALALLTRLGPARLVDNACLEASVPFYPLVGAIIGAVCVLPCYLGVAGDLPWVQAWLYAGVNLWLTRALHWDGLADLADAWGSGAQGAQFWSILKDSRTGVFGALALIFCFSGMLVLTQAHCAADNFLPLLFAPLVGRSACVALAALGRARAPDSLAAPIIAGARPCVAVLSICAAFLPVAACVPLKAFLVLAAALLVVIFRLHTLGLRQGGLNGDFLGASVVLAEMMTLAATLP
ncbi:MAG: adenosylcobinamide-GDP ribazoletransferase [Deltaproteobacteria bacterium]|jgi:adenosylcobinamide-GDP ribazoletransferase|nr:adenosylcobinamide-GDP ribazoletransferase [Deltaproteobacteria bacterium]